MDYYINEYSLRGQFGNVREFLDSLKVFTLPVLKKIESEEGNAIWKKESLWNCNVCSDIKLGDIHPNKNERDPTLTSLKKKLQKLYNSKPYFCENSNTGTSIVEYGFDKDFRDGFQVPNCFILAWDNEGRIVSFWHPSYQEQLLPIIVRKGGEAFEEQLDNIISSEWWDQAPEIRHWRINSNYKVEVRGKEFDFHPPHFHVIMPDCTAVFHLETGELYDYHGRPPHDMENIVKQWHGEHKTELMEAWDSLHPPVTYKNN